MKRRDFLKSSAMLAGTSMVPASALAGINATHKYPLIGQKAYGVIMPKEIWERINIGVHPNVQKNMESKIISVGPLSNGMVEVFVKKTETFIKAGYSSFGLPMILGYTAHTIIDLETFRIMKCRTTGQYKKYLEIPVGANKALVMKNRKLLEDSV